MIDARGLQEFLERRLAGEDIGLYRFGIGAGAPGNSDIYADVTEISGDGAKSLLAKLGFDKAA